MKIFKVNLTGPALADADDAFQWLLDQAPDAAFQWYEGLLDAVATLAHNPFRCPLATEAVLFDSEIHQLFYGRYRILFTISGRTVFVLHIRHGARRHLEKDFGPN